MSRAKEISNSSIPDYEKVRALKELGTPEAQGYLNSLAQAKAFQGGTGQEPKMKLTKQMGTPEDGILYLFQLTHTPDGFIASLDTNEIKGPFPYDELSASAAWEDTDANGDDIIDTIESGDDTAGPSAAPSFKDISSS